MAWLTGWKYRKSITLSRASGAVTNYQMKLLLGESSGAAGEDVDCGGLCLSNFNDIRFTNSDGYTLLNYWIESLSGTTPNQLATIWIKFDSIGTTNTTFYMYYGKSDATNVSNGSNTFNFFDNFDSTLNTTLWDQNSATVTISGSVIDVTAPPGGAWKGITSDSTFSIGKRYRTKGSIAVGTAIYGGIGFVSVPEADPSAPCAILFSGYSTNGFYLRTGNVSTDDTTVTGQDGNTHIYEITWKSGQVVFYKDGSTLTTKTTQIPVSDLKIGASAYAATSTTKMDWVFVSSFVDVEPVWGTWSEAAEWLSGWKYRKSITLSRASGAVSNYQMKLLVGETSGATGENVDCAGLCLSNFNDIRFTNSNGTTLLDYWIESITGVSPNQLATIWIEFDTIGVDATTFYMYYGNSSATSLSNGSNTFIKFDGFEWGSQGSNLTFSGGSNTWTSIQGTATIDTSTYYGTGTRSARFPGASTYPVYSMPCIANENSSIQVRVYKETAVTNGPNIGQGNGTKGWNIWVNSSELIYYYTGSSVSTGVNMTADTWQLFEFNNFNYTAGTYDIWLNGTKITTGATMFTNSSYSGVLAILNADTSSSNDVWYDNIIVRNWVAAEPSWGTWSTTLEYVDSYTKLLIHGNRNIGLVDSATGKTITVNGGAAISSGKTITTNGNAAIVSGRAITVYGNAQLSTIKSKFGGSSGLFDGTDDRISVPASSDFDFGTGDFTIDFWVYFTSIAGYQYFFDIGYDNSHLYYYNTNWYIRNPAATTILTWANTPATNTWIHVAIGRNGTNWFLFTDGVLRKIATSSAAYGASDKVFTVGNYGGGSTYGLKGYMDEFRVSKGILRWSTDFNLATAPYETDSYTKLLLHFNDISTFYDHSLCRPYFGDVGYFDGTNSYLSLVDNADWYFGTGNFTVEFWVRFNAFPTENVVELFCMYTSASARFTIELQNYSSVYSIVFNPNNSTPMSVVWTTPTLYTWYHLALVRDGLTSTKVYIDGTQIGATFTTNYTCEDTSSILAIGATYNAQLFFNGYLDELRVSKGIARWTSNFNPSTVPYDSDSYTKLLIHFNNVSSATTFYDYSIYRPYFNESIYFNGSSGYLTLVDSDDWYFGTEPFTIDFWLKYTNTGASQALIGQSQDATNRWYFYIQDDYLIGLQQGSSYATFTPSTTNDGSWHHMAFIGRYNMIAAYIDGIFKGSIPYYVQFSNFAAVLSIGARYYSSWGIYLNGYIDELRVSKGIARWIDNFTPPTSEYFIIPEILSPTSKRPLCVYSGEVKELSVGDAMVISGEYQLTCSSTIEIDFTSYDVQSIILTCNTVFTLNNIINGRHCVLVITQDVVGGRTATFSNTIKWFQGAIPTLSIVGGITDIFTFIKSRDTIYGYCSKAFQVGS